MQVTESQLVTLGPAGTFSELAAQTWLKQQSLDLTINLQDSLPAVIEAVNESQLGLAPIENLSEGFVSPVVDSLVHKSLHIIAELTLPVEFQIVTNHPSPRSIYAQFVAAGQCRRALQQLALPVTHTSSNSESLNSLLGTSEPSAALVPSHIQCPDQLTLLSSRAADIAHNETRFVVLSANNLAPAYDPNRRWKSSVLLIDDNDHPGLLVDSLSVFARRAINLTSIVSRPTGGGFGQYHFFIDFDGHIQQSHVQEALEQLAKLNHLRWLGSYQAA
ncbi:MAG: prephenate dehydratase [Pseudomonadota bacterium]